MIKKKAFTLLELIVSLAIISVLVLIISSMISLNFKVSSRIFKEDRSYKEACNAMLYVENIVREAEEIEEIDDPVCNFKALMGGGSVYSFYFIEDEKKLMVDIDGKKGQGNNWIGMINDMILTYDGDEKVLIWMEGLDGEIYQTSINIGERR